MRALRKTRGKRQHDEDPRQRSGQMRQWRSWCLCGIMLSLWACGAPEPPIEPVVPKPTIKVVKEHTTDHKHDEPMVFADTSMSVAEAVSRYCSTSSVRGLSEQLIAELNCLRPGTMASLRGIRGLDMGGAVMPYLQKPAVDALKRALQRRGGIMYMNSAIRTLAQQYLLYQWYLRGRCSIALAAPPGNSNHESGLAIDISGYSGWRPTLSGTGFRWLGSRDPVHFDYIRGGVDIRSLSVRAFQRLWNRNHPNDRIAEDGSFGGATANRLSRAPANGFAKGATCGQTEPPANDKAPIEVYWSRGNNGQYALRALAGGTVQRVNYLVDGFLIGTATRQDGDNFPTSYTFHLQKQARNFQVKGYDQAGKLIAVGVGLMDVTKETGVYIKQMGDKLYEIGLERPPAGVASMEVRIDGYLLRDSVSQLTRTTRHASRSPLTKLGQRKIEIKTFNQDGTVRGYLRRTFTFQ